MSIVQRKSVEQINDDILAEYGELLNDHRLGAVIRTFSYAVATEIGGAFFELWKLEQGFYIRTAKGSELDDKAADFKVTREPAKAAIVSLRFSGTLGSPIPALSLASAPANDLRDRVQFKTASSGVYTVGASGYVDVPATCLTPGEIGNLAAGSIVQLDNPITGITAVTNPAASTMGLPQETDDQLRARLLRTIEGLSRGTLPALRHGALDFRRQQLTLLNLLPTGQDFFEVAEDLTQIPLPSAGILGLNDNKEVVYYAGLDLTKTPHRIIGVTRGQESTSDQTHQGGITLNQYVPDGESDRVVGVQLKESVGRVDLYIDAGTPTPACTELVGLVQLHIHGEGVERFRGWKGAGVPVVVHAAQITLISVTADVLLEKGYNAGKVLARVRETLTRLINGWSGEELPGSLLACVIQDTEGVAGITSFEAGDGTRFVGVTGILYVPETYVSRAGVLMLS
jgi:uncharacterized phage protein gp47/JayE